VKPEKVRFHRRGVPLSPNAAGNCGQSSAKRCKQTAGVSFQH
jgi:hypothetical protein